MDLLQKIADYRQDQTQVTGLVGHYTFFTDPADPLFEVAESTGYDLTCRTVREKVTFTSVTNGGRIHQDPLRLRWGKLLKPGDYRELTIHSYWQTCFLVPPDASSRIEILNQDLGGSVPHA
jgi:hypothetical protein